MERTLVSRLLPPVEIGTSDSFSRHSTAAGILIGGFVVLLTIWTLLAPVSGAIVAMGSVKVDMNRRTLQHQEGGIVKKLLVRDGQRVKAGQPLLVLQDLQTDASNGLTQSQYDAELIRSARLNAEKVFASHIDYPEVILSRKSDARIKELLDKENVLFRTRRGALDQQVMILEKQAKQSEQEAAAFKQKVNASVANIDLQRDELTANEGLVAKGFIAPTRIMTVKRAVIDYEIRLRQDQADLAAVEQKASDLQFRIAFLKSQYTQAAATEVKESATKLMELEERLRPVRDAAQRLTVVAPVDGEVVALKITSVDMVVAPRDPLMDIVPDAAKLIIEAKVRPEYAQQVKQGSVADVRLTGYMARITPTVEGKVTYVSSDRLVERTANGESAYFEIHVEVEKHVLEKAGNLELRAGMPAEVHVRTIDRAPIQYLFDPLTAFFSRGLREQ